LIMKRIIPLLLALSLLFCSCGAPKTKDYFVFKEKSKNTHENGLADNDTVMTVNGHKVNYSELYYYMSVLDATKDEIEDKVLPEMLFSRSVALMAEEEEIELTDDEYKSLKEYFKEAEEGEDHEKQLSIAAMTPALFRFLALQSQLTAKVYEHYTTEGASPVKASDEMILESTENGELIRVKHILIKVDEVTTDEAAKAEAEAVVTKLSNGEAFDALISLHSDYESENDVAVGEYIYRYEMPDTFEEVAFSLEEGQTSEIVYVVSEKYVGYHIIRRLPIEKSYVENNLDTLRTNYMASKFYETAYNRIADLEIEYTENFDKVK